jgi:hypothetical protein
VALAEGGDTEVIAELIACHDEHNSL